MRVKRLLVAMTGLTVLLAGFTPAAAADAATADSPSAHGARTQPSALRPLPPAPRLPRGVKATAPYVAPAADFDEFVRGHLPVPCSNGTLCPVVWNPVAQKWRQYHLSVCSAYQLFFWQGDGDYFDNQTGNVRSYFYDRQGRELYSFTPDRVTHPYNWDAVWSIRNC
ncbi:hypothetical protein ACFY0F_38690 [Streptomyces sp. NPDC001544]|uniref:hypothetical protein n=1 Tax=Streptomyces sp. NPDC001544 TaxID=3364584 RepID=UPI0036BE15F6